MTTRERRGQLFVCAAREQMSDGLDRPEPHPRRRARGEDAEDQLLPEPLVRGRAPHLLELREARAYVAPPLDVCGANLLQRDGLSISPHLFDTYFKNEAGLTDIRLERNSMGALS